MSYNLLYQYAILKYHIITSPVKILLVQISQILSKVYLCVYTYIWRSASKMYMGYATIHVF